jgi:hypothetical protein
MFNKHKGENNMEFPKEKVIRINGLKIKIKPYLTTTIIDAILNSVIQVEDYALRTTMADAMVMAQCTDLVDFHTEDESVNIDTVDIYRANGVIDAVTREISGYEILLSGLADLSVRDIYTRFENVIAEFTKEFKDINLDEQQKKFETTLNELKEVEAKKEEILSGK